MKSVLFAALSLGFVSQAFAGIYCLNGVVYNDARSDCDYEIFAGDLCFTGRRDSAIRLINSGALNRGFLAEGTERAENARPRGEDRIAYTYVNENDGGRYTRTFGRCPRD